VESSSSVCPAAVASPRSSSRRQQETAGMRVQLHAA
jgi:hypothetical protein